MANIGVQLMMVRSEIADQGMFPVLERVAGLGYTSVEVSQVPTDEANVAALERARTELGLDVAALSVGLKKGPTTTGDALDADFAKIVDDCRRLDCRFARIGMMPFEAMVSKNAVLAFARDAERAAQRLAAEGITLAYHNHHVDFATYDGETCSTSCAGSHPRCTSRSTCTGCSAAAAIRSPCCGSSPARSSWCISRTTGWRPCPSLASNC